MVTDQRPGDILIPPPILPTLMINGRRLTYACVGVESGAGQNQSQSQGEAQPIVLVHGFGGFFMDWPRVMAPLSRHTRVYALDLPGWGFSDSNPHANTMEDDAWVVGEFIRRLNLKRAIVCGISYGAGVAWAAAAMKIPDIERVVLLNPMPTFPLKYMRSPLYRGIFLLNASWASAYWGHRYLQKPQYKLICKESLLNFRLIDSFYLDLAYLVIKQPKLSHVMHAHARGAREVDWRDWEARLRDVEVPVSILQGRQDRIFTIESARRLHRLIPTSELIEVERCGHAMVFDQHKRISDFLLDCLKRSKATTAIEVADAHQVALHQETTVTDKAG